MFSYSTSCWFQRRMDEMRRRELSPEGVRESKLYLNFRKTNRGCVTNLFSAITLTTAALTTQQITFTKPDFFLERVKKSLFLHVGMLLKGLEEKCIRICEISKLPGILLMNLCQYFL